MVNESKFGPGEPIDPEDPEDAVRVICTNSDCTEGIFVHLSEEEPNCGHQKQKRQKRRTNSKQLPVLGRPPGCPGGVCVGSPGSGGHSYGSFIAPRMRSRTLSLGSAAGLRFGGNSSHQAAGGESRTPPEGGHAMDHPHSYGSAGGNWARRDRQRSEGALGNEYFSDEQVRSTGSIFKRRDTITSFYRVLPKWKVNGFHIKMEDDCPQGNDDTRIFLLTTLGDHKMREIACLLCNQSMVIYDRYPLIDGTFFLSPVNHAHLGLPVRHEGRDSFLLAACMECLETGSRRLHCLRCGQSGWFLGDRLMLGSLYTYDIISSSPCCPPCCRSCHYSLPLPDPMLEQQRHFSAFSEASNCPKCSTRDHHYVRRIDALKLADAQEMHAQQQNGLLGASALIVQMA